MDKREVRVKIEDTANNLNERVSCYEMTDIFLICYDMTSSSAFDDISKKWIPEIKTEFTGKVPPYCLVGLKSDLLPLEKKPSKSIFASIDSDSDYETTFVGNEFQKNAAQDCDAAGYCTTSAKQFKNIHKLIDVIKLVYAKAQNRK